MKKYMLVSLVIAFLVVTVGGSCLAGTVANTSKKGSLLIFPLIRTDFVSGGESWETLITIANDNVWSVQVQCVYVIKTSNGISMCDHLSSQPSFELTANQPITFRASDGTDLGGRKVMGGIGKGDVAELKCWVAGYAGEDEDLLEPTQAISYNHLTGEATLLRQYGTEGVASASYSAWRFAANATQGTEVAIPTPDGKDNIMLQLDGEPNNYDSCPAYLWFDFLRQAENPAASEYTSSVDNYVAIVPCKQDLSQDGGPTVMKLDVRTWDENEFSEGGGAFCLNCFVATSLADAPFFPYADLDTPAGAFKTTPYATLTGGTECNLPKDTPTYPVVGVILKKFGGVSGPITAVTPTGSEAWKSNDTDKGVATITFPVQ